MNEQGTSPIIVSACLAGMRCVCCPSIVLEDPEVVSLVGQGRAIPICPEQVGGLPTPRPSAGLVGGMGADLWSRPGVVHVLTTERKDVSEQFMRGAREVLRLARLCGAGQAILNEGSPSCGVNSASAFDRDGTLVTLPGPGVVAPLLAGAGIQVMTVEAWKHSADGGTVGYRCDCG